MKQEELVKLNQTYNKWLELENSAAEKVGWSEELDQTSRWEQFLKLQKLKSFKEATILDVGCGDGALIDYLRCIIGVEHVNVTGIDPNERFIALAKKDYPWNEFIQGEFLMHEFEKEYDFIMCSGAFNVQVFGGQDRAYFVLEQAIKKMVEISKYGVCVNFLCKSGCSEYVLTNEMVVYDEQRVLAYCKNLGVKSAELIMGYDPVDATIIIEN
jgi:SAM-dependent methyltransferase